VSTIFFLNSNVNTPGCAIIDEGGPPQGVPKFHMRGLGNWENKENTCKYLPSWEYIGTQMLRKAIKS